MSDSTGAAHPRPDTHPGTNASEAPGARPRFAPRASWLAAIAGAVIMGIAAWWGLTVAGIDWGRPDYGGPSDRTQQWFVIGTIAFPLLVALVSPLSIAGPLAMQAALDRPDASFARRFGSSLLRLLALVGGLVLAAGVLVLVGALITNPIGAALRIGSAAYDMAGLTPVGALMWAALMLGTGFASGITGLALATVVSGVALRR